MYIGIILLYELSWLDKPWFIRFQTRSWELYAVTMLFLSRMLDGFVVTAVSMLKSRLKVVFFLSFFFCEITFLVCDAEEDYLY